MIARPTPFVSLSRPERIDTVPFTPNSIIRVGGGGLLPSDRWYWGLVCVFEGRFTNPSTGGPSALSADGLPAIIERFTVQGYHRIRQQNQTFFDLRGCDAKILGDFYSGLSLHTEPASYNFGANAANDVRIYYVLPFVPCNVGPLTAASYLLDAPNYDALQFTIQCGDPNSVFASGTAPTLSAFGSATGSPAVRVNGLFALAGPSRFSGQLPGRVFVTHQEYTDSRMTTSASSVRLHDIVRGNFVRALTLKTGVKKVTGITAGNNAYASLSNTVLSNVRVFRGINSIVRDYPLYHDIREEELIAASMAGGSSSFRFPVGYARIDWAKHGLLGESFDARPLVAGPTGQVDFYLAADVIGATNQALMVMTEEIRWAPGQP